MKHYELASNRLPSSLGKVHIREIGAPDHTYAERLAMRNCLAFASFDDPAALAALGRLEMQAAEMERRSGRRA
jgi:hypothetical protein